MNDSSCMGEWVSEWLRESIKDRKRTGPNNRLTIGQRVGSEGKYYSSTTDYVKNNYKLINSNYKYFEIYEK